MFLNHVALAIPMRDAEKLQKKIRVAAASGCSGLFRAFCGFGQLARELTSRVAGLDNCPILQRPNGEYVTCVCMKLIC